MELNPHDLLRIQGMEDLYSGCPFPDWVRVALVKAPYVVVRRAEHIIDGVPVGIRGAERGQRFAAWLHPDKILEVITPGSLINPAHWKIAYPFTMPATIQTLTLIAPVMQMTGYGWGPTGSSGFELATGISSIKDTSDLDLVIHLPEKITKQQGSSLLEQLEKLSLVGLDIQMNTPAGGVAIREYILAEQVLVKTSTAPVLQDANCLWS
ncbi:malonate decarboxylase holo-ACP synthase [Pedobacter sp. L105]|uniref:malonate decarboxylase holo-ACP synthase n=1 Tax=Pedobacter sp. L105 TaxID=1641871 RepID=UPI00131AC323|nr:malonate decarboxylase holo-ACP synthase [Pedobacter sp. L105]